MNMYQYQYQSYKYESQQSLRSIPLTNPIIQGFIANQHYLNLLQQALKYPTKQNRYQLDWIFKMYLSEIRLLSYFSTLIERYAIDLVKKERKYLQRMLLIFDQETPNEGFQSVGEKLVFKSAYYEAVNRFRQLKPLFTCHLIENLTKLQEQVIIYYYFNQVCDSDIGKMLNISQQAVWKIRQRALKRIKKSYKEEC